MGDGVLGQELGARTVGSLTVSGVHAASVAAPAGPVTEMGERYRRCLLVERGLTQATAHVYVEAVRPSVASVAADVRVELEWGEGG